MDPKNKYSLSLILFRFRNSPLYSFTVVVAIVTVSTLLLFLLVIPQYQQLLIDQQEIKEIRERISVLKKNKSFIESLDKNVLQSNYETVTTALPPDKDYAGVLNSIAAAAVESSVALQDYEFSVGPLASSAAVVSNAQEITLRLNLLAATDATQKFLEIMNQTLPLVSELSAKTSDLDNRITEIEILFHSKDFPIVTIDPRKVIKPLALSDNELIQTLEVWKVRSDNIGSIDFIDTSSSSGNIKPF